jgi:lipopolysaccharide/colanic/teichoic acid biosynthesis glycosyltransferase
MNDLSFARLGLPAPSTHPLYDRIVGQLLRMRWQLTFGLCSAVIAPALLTEHLIGPSRDSPLGPLAVDASLLATLMAFLLGFMIFRKVTAFPGIRATAYILPVFAIAYALVAAYFFVLRGDFSRWQLGISFILLTAQYYFFHFLASRAAGMEFAVVPTGEATKLWGLKGVTWKVLAKPDAVNSSMPIAVDLRADLPPIWERFVADCAVAGRAVFNAQDVHESLTGRVQIRHISENTFGSLTPDAIYAPLKRYTDFTFALLALVLLAPALAALAIAIRLESKGPALFIQSRMGYRGNVFTMFKFRSMRQPTPEEEASLMNHDEARITRIGRFIRRTRIDELPQLFNILRGEMSWIGPRPEALSLSKTYEANIPFYRYRHIVRPGITGWAQVNQGHTLGVESADLKLQYDFFYVKHFSLWLDVLVAMRTAAVMFSGFGAR